LASAARWWLLGALVASPAYLVKLRFAGLEPNLLEVLLLIGLALTVLARPRPRAWFLQWPALALLAAGTLALLWSPDRHSSFGIYRQFLVEPVLAGYALYLLLERRQDVWLAGWALVAAGLLPALGELGSAMQQLGQFRTWDVHPPTGFYLNANFAAQMIVPALAVALGLALQAERRWRVAALAAAAVLLLGLVVSYSRGGFLGLAGALVVVWWLGIRRKLPFALGGVAAAALALLAIPRMLDRLRHELDPHDPNNTVLSRLPIWRAAVRMIHDHPLTGVGLNSFAQQLRSYAPDVQESHTHPHNVLLNFWVVLGVLGLAAYLWAIVWIGRAIAAGLARRDELRPLQVGLAAALAAILLHGLVDSTIWRNDLGLQFWVLAAVATAR
jgi:O-antigen ligase